MVYSAIMYTHSSNILLDDGPNRSSSPNSQAWSIEKRYFQSNHFYSPDYTQKPDGMFIVAICSISRY